MSWFDKILVKLNPGQQNIFEEEGEKYTTIPQINVVQAYKRVEVVQRGSNMITEACASINFDVKEKLNTVGLVQNFNPKRLYKILNIRPNNFMDINTFRSNIYIDLVLEGNAFIYFDGQSLYNLPASKITIVPDPKTWVSRYTYNTGSRQLEYFPNEIIHIRDPSSNSMYRGDSRLLSALNTINTLNAMIDFQQNFFKNNAIPGLVISTPNVLSDKIKDRKIRDWAAKYNPRVGGKAVMILDGDFKLDSLGNTDFRELDFANSINIHEETILKALGVPSLLLSSGNNANISPNLKLFYSETIIPVCQKLNSAFEFFFGYDLKLDISRAMALRPELKDESAYLTSLVNAGILTPNEARIKLRYEEKEGGDKLIPPANIAGSAASPDGDTGGKPKDEEE